jgi:hypothetical protein
LWAERASTSASTTVVIASRATTLLCILYIALAGVPMLCHQRVQIALLPSGNSSQFWMRWVGIEPSFQWHAGLWREPPCHERLEGN